MSTSNAQVSLRQRAVENLFRNGTLIQIWTLSSNRVTISTVVFVSDSLPSCIYVHISIRAIGIDNLVRISFAPVGMHHTQDTLENNIGSNYCVRSLSIIAGPNGTTTVPTLTLLNTDESDRIFVRIRMQTLGTGGLVRSNVDLIVVLQTQAAAPNRPFTMLLPSSVGTAQSRQDIYIGPYNRILTRSHSQVASPNGVSAISTGSFANDVSSTVVFAQVALLAHGSSNMVLSSLFSDGMLRTQAELGNRATAIAPFLPLPAALPSRNHISSTRIIPEAAQTANLFNYIPIVLDPLSTIYAMR